ncbi:MAG: ERF family protein [Desulfamplus sp.]|nr:ERF family protein [Desulfamplus sp.]
MNIYEKLNLVQSQLKAPKDMYNSYGNFKYRSLENIVEAVKPLLAQYGLSLTLSDAVKLIGDRFYVEATAALINIEQPDQCIVTTALAREAISKKGMDESQITGAASSYARKYCLNGLFNIDDTKDADFPMQHEHNNNNHSTHLQSQVNYSGNQSTYSARQNFQPPPPPATQPINNYPPANTVPNNSQPQQSQQQPNNDDSRLSGKQYKFILSLMGSAKKSKDELDKICISNYGKTLQYLSKRDASQLIESLVPNN